MGIEQEEGFCQTCGGSHPTEQCKLVRGSDGKTYDLDNTAPELYKEGGPLHEHARNETVRILKEEWKKYVQGELDNGRTLESIEKAKKQGKGYDAPNSSEYKTAQDMLMGGSLFSPHESFDVERRILAEVFEEFKSKEK